MSQKSVNEGRRRFLQGSVVGLGVAFVAGSSAAGASQPTKILAADGKVVEVGNNFIDRNNLPFLTYCGTVQSVESGTVIVFTQKQRLISGGLVAATKYLGASAATSTVNAGDDIIMCVEKISGTVLSVETNISLYRGVTIAVDGQSVTLQSVLGDNEERTIIVPVGDALPSLGQLIQGKGIVDPATGIMIQPRSVDLGPIAATQVS